MLLDRHRNWRIENKMKFATIGHLDYKSRIEQIPKEWIHKKLIVSPEINIYKTNGYIIALKLTAQQMMNHPRDKIRKSILDAAFFAQNELGVDVIQLGALTTSVTSGGKWLEKQKKYTGFVTHGDSYTAAVTCQATVKILNLLKKQSSELNLAILGAYGIIGEAVSKKLVSKFAHSVLIGPRKKKLKELETKLKGNFETTVDLKTKDSDVIITSTNHPTALLNSNHLKENAIVVDVSQPPNLSLDVCQMRSDICRIDGGYVDFPADYHMPIPGMPVGKIFACIAEVIMQAMEDEHKNHVGSINMKHLQKTEKWAKKYGYLLKELTNFGKTIAK